MAKRGQLKIQQMAIMLLAVTLFFVLAGMFILVFKVSSLKQEATVIQENNAKLLVTEIANSPELSCGSSYGTGISSCIDEDKVMALEGMMNIYGYGSFWGIQGLQIRDIYPGNYSNVECTNQNFPDCGVITLIKGTNGTGISNFVSLCRKQIPAGGGQPYNQCDIGEVIITYSGVQ